MIVSLTVKDFKKYLKSVKSYSDLSHKKSMLVTFDLRDNPKVIYQNEHVILSSSYDLKVVENSGSQLCTMDLSVLDNVTLLGKTVEISWGDDTEQTINIKSGKLNLDFKIRSGNPEMPPFDEERDFRVNVPYGLLRELSMYAMMPFAFYKEASKEFAPIHFYEEEGKLKVGLDDGFCVGRLSTGYEAPEDLDIKIPRLYLETLYTDRTLSDEFVCTIATLGDAVFLNNENTFITGSQTNKPMNDFNMVSTKQHWTTSCLASPDVLIENYKPLMSLIPTKSQGQYITAMFVPPGELKFTYKHFNGDAKVDGIAIKELAIHNSKYKSIMHLQPKSFIEFLNLLKGLPEVLWQGSHEASKFSVQTESLLIEYIYPLIII